jgi:hypothetical protein
MASKPACRLRLDGKSSGESLFHDLYKIQIDGRAGAESEKPDRLFAV